jgi:hypothetical protein
MNLAEFKRRLMTEPGLKSPEMLEARQAGGEYAAAATRSDRFERSLQRALTVPVPHALAEQIILRQSLQAPERDNAVRPAWLAMAAAVVLAVALTSYNMLDRGDHSIAPDDAVPSLAQLQEHLSWHWTHDGPQAVAAALQTPTDQMQLAQLLSELGLQLEPALLEQVRLGKFCPTPNGAGAHLVLVTDEGPITAYFMPRTRLPESPLEVTLENGQASWAVNLERGSLALIAEPGKNLPARARELIEQLSIAPGVTI